MVVGFTHEVMASSYEKLELRRTRKAHMHMERCVICVHGMESRRSDWVAGCISDPAHREPSPRAKLEPLPLAITRSPPCPVNPQ